MKGQIHPLIFITIIEFFIVLLIIGLFSISRYSFDKIVIISTETLKDEQEIKTRLNLSKCRSSRDSFPPPVRHLMKSIGLQRKGPWQKRTTDRMIVPFGHLNFLYRQNFSDQTVKHDTLFPNSAAGLAFVFGSSCY